MTLYRLQRTSTYNVYFAFHNNAIKWCSIIILTLEFKN